MGIYMKSKIAAYRKQEKFKFSTIDRASIEATELLSSPDVRQRVLAEWYRQGLTARSITAVYKGAARAKRTTFLRGGKKFSEPDWSVRLKAAEMFATLLGIANAPVVIASQQNLFLGLAKQDETIDQT